MGKYVSSENVTILKEVFSATANGFGRAFYQPNEFTVFQDSYAFEFVDKSINITKIHYFITTSLNKIYSQYDWGNKSGWNKIKERFIKLPTKNGEIDFEFMESFVAELEARHVAELEAYLTITGLENYELTEEEKIALNQLEVIKWNQYNLEKLFGKSTRGKRLKSADRISGDLIFVTAGETNEGISAYIGNDVKIFPRNTITIDMFGSAKYRNYDYGADDHITVVHTQNINDKAVIFITSSIHKTSYNGQFNYGRNFYAKDADKLNINLPTKNNKIDFEFMELFISAIQKLIIKDVVIYAKKRERATNEILDKNSKFVYEQK